jgi:ubiquinone/menaquinone biosynthesis C-methylase UbiE
MILPNNLNTIDFGELYKQQRSHGDFKLKSAIEWDTKADTMAKNLGGIYPQALCEAINTSDCKTLIDCGAGAGAICLKLANKFERIYALDFSQKMLEALMQNASDRGIHNITPIKFDIESNWENIPCADIIIASRSTEVADMQTTLKHINDHAKKRVYVTSKVGGSFLHAPILEAIGREVAPKPDYMYIVNILYNMGIYASVSFIQSEGMGFNYHNETEYIKSIEWSIGKLNETEKERLAKYFESLRQTKRLYDEKISWALIEWSL